MEIQFFLFSMLEISIFECFVKIFSVEDWYQCCQWWSEALQKETGKNPRKYGGHPNWKFNFAIPIHVTFESDKSATGKYLAVFL